MAKHKMIKLLQTFQEKIKKKIFFETFEVTNDFFQIHERQKGKQYRFGYD